MDAPLHLHLIEISPSPPSPSLSLSLSFTLRFLSKKKVIEARLEKVFDVKRTTFSDSDFCLVAHKSDKFEVINKF